MFGLGNILWTVVVKRDGILGAAYIVVQAKFKPAPASLINL
jgi:hypothetical protein